MQQQSLKTFKQGKSFKAHVLALACSAALFPAMSMANDQPAPKAVAEKPAHAEQVAHRFERGDDIPGGAQAKRNDKEYLPEAKKDDSKSKIEGAKGQKGLKGTVGPQAETQCTDYNQFASLTGQALFDHVRSVDISCIYQLFDNDATSVAAYQSQNVVDVANRALSIAASYDSRTGNEMLKLITFLRAAFYVEYYNDSLTYTDSSVANAVTDVLVAYGTNPYFTDTSDMQAETLTEFFIAWGNTGSYKESVPSIARYLNGFSVTHLANANHSAAMTKAFTTLYYARSNTNFTQNAESYSDLLDALVKVATADYIINSSSSFQSKDAFHEFARFYVYHADNNLSANLKTRLNNGTVAYKDKFDLYSAQWADAADYLSYYNPNDCQQFGVCNWKENLEANVLSVDYSCSGTIAIRAQQMTTSELQQSCDLMGEEEILFHNVLATGNQPVADDYNSNLEVNIFNSTDDYIDFAGTIFGISTDNGGMYLEGTPSQQGNQARFIAHEATWLNDVLVWNLGHEYVHYLDGRYNLYGSFSHFDNQTDKSVWWTEGLAEYISKQNRNDDAIALARAQTFTLSEILANDYNSSTERVYSWGYLAVRFMFENHRADVDELLVHARAGDTTSWLNYINSNIAQYYDAEWNTWLASVTSNDAGIDTGVTPPTDSDGDGVIDSEDAFPFDPSETKDTDGDGVGDNADAFPTDATETKDTDGDGVGDNSDVFPNDPSEWADSDGDGIGDNADIDNGTTPVEDCGVATITGGNLVADNAHCVAGTGRNSYYTYVDADNTPLYISTAGGSGDVNVYFNQNTWADVNSYTAKSENIGNNELVSVTANRGWVYISLVAVSEYQGVSITVSETEPTGGNPGNGGGDPVTPTPVVEDACATENPYSYGGLNADDAICIADGNASYYFYIPNGATEVTVKSGNGSGDVNLYGDSRTWASASSYEVKSENSGNAETLTISNPTSGWYYISAEGAPSSTGASLVVSVKN